MKINKSILIVDDEVSMRKNISDLLIGEGLIIIEAIDGLEAIEKARLTNPNLIILDINLPKVDGITVLNEFKKIIPDVPVIILTAYGTSERAIEAMKAGAFDYLEKPFDLEEFLLIVRRSLSYSDLIAEVRQLRSQVSAEKVPLIDTQLIGRSAKMQEIFKIIGRVAPTNATVLIQGESGTGKELVADAIQRHSLRKEKPFIKINCGALPESILESEIFGHEKGAFTGAIVQRQGRFELANNGTIFLDEIDNMPNALQVKLLRVLQDGSFERVGGKETLIVDVRIIAATNKDIEQEVHAKRFREDLFYRLNVVRIKIPSLRERPEDIPVLVDYFLRKHNPNNAVIFPPESLMKLQFYSWPGNVRELENIIQSSLVLSKGKILTIDNIPMMIKSDEDGILYESMLSKRLPLKQIIADIEKGFIIKALKQANWNRTQAAKILHIHRRLLYSKMKEYKIKSDENPS